MTDSPRVSASSKSGEPSALVGQSRKILGLLVSRATSTDPTITYAEVARAIGIHVCNLKHPLDHLSRTLDSYAARTGMQIPPIQLLVVNGKTGLPRPGASAHIHPPYAKTGERYDTEKQRARGRSPAPSILRYPHFPIGNGSRMT